MARDRFSRNNPGAREPRSSYDEAADLARLGAGPQGPGRPPRRRRRDEGPVGRGPAGLFKVFALIVCLVVLRLFWLQVIQGPGLSQQAIDAHVSTVPLVARRGTIYDRNGNVLAMSVECRTFYCNPRAVSDRPAAAQLLASELGGKAEDYLSIMQQDSGFAYLKRRVDTETAKGVLEKLEDAGIKGINALTDEMRVYPYGATAGQVLGFIGTDGHGLTGLEAQYEDVLAGTDGEMRMEVGADGSTQVAGAPVTTKQAKDGTDIVTSLDVNIQAMAEEQVAQGVKDHKADSGTVVVTEPKSGEVLAICTTPLYDPTDAASMTNEALKLSCVSDSYEPGSVFKVLTMAIAYDAGAVSEDTKLSVPGKVKVGDDLVGDDDGRAETMEMDVREIMRRSSNVGAVMVSRKVGEDAFAKGVSAFGIGSKSGIDFPGEVAGMVTGRSDYKTNTMGVMSFGQGLAVPMIQIVRAVGAIANDGTLTTPHLVTQKGTEKVDWDSGDRACSKEAADFVTDTMRTVVQEGTGTKAQVKGFDIAGKTGTGEQAGETGGYVAGKFLSSFVGFANADDAQVLVYVGLNGTGQLASSSAAPVFSAIMEEALTDLSVKPTS